MPSSKAQLSAIRDINSLFHHYITIVRLTRCSLRLHLAPECEDDYVSIATYSPQTAIKAITWLSEEIKNSKGGLTKQDQLGAIVVTFIQSGVVGIFLDSNSWQRAPDIFSYNFPTFHCTKVLTRTNPSLARVQLAARRLHPPRGSTNRWLGTLAGTSFRRPDVVD